MVGSGSDKFAKKNDLRMFPLNLQKELKCRTFLLLRQYMQFIHFSKSLFCI